MDALRNQIVERKVIELIVDKAKVTEKELSKENSGEASEFAIYHSVLAAKEDAAIPEAKYDDDTAPTAENAKEKVAGSKDED